MIEVGSRVVSPDRGNIGEVVSMNGQSCEVLFVNPHTGDSRKLKFNVKDLQPLAHVGAGPLPITNGNGRTREPIKTFRKPEEIAAAERILLGSLLQEPQTLDKAAVSDLRGDDFLDRTLGQLFDVLAILRLNGFPLYDLKLLMPELRKLGIIESPEAVNPTYLARLVQESIGSAHATHYAMIVADASRSRKIIELASRIAAAGGTGCPAADLEMMMRDGLESIDGKMPMQAVSLKELAISHNHLRPVVIDGLARRGETINMVAPSKFGKSWLVYGLAFSVIHGFDWLDTFHCEQGRVLLIDNELHANTIVNRLQKLCEAAGATWEDVAGRFEVVSLRGTGTDLHGLKRLFDRIPKEKYNLVILDAWYRFFPAGINENDNAQVMSLYNTLDGYAEKAGCAIVVVHHASKGPQGNKAVTDVGAGAGAQSRAADTHIILRPHEQDGVIVMEAAVRSFPPLKPLSIRWEYPQWRPTDADPARLKRESSVKEQKQQAEDKEGIRKIYSALFENPQGGTASEIRGWTGLGRYRCERLLDVMQSEGQLERNETERRGNRTPIYRLATRDVVGEI